MSLDYIAPSIKTHGSVVRRTLGASNQTSSEFGQPGGPNIPRTGSSLAVATNANSGTGGSGTF
jgi:hypothetical protein